MKPGSPTSRNARRPREASGAAGTAEARSRDRPDAGARPRYWIREVALALLVAALGWTHPLRPVPVPAARAEEPANVRVAPVTDGPAGVPAISMTPAAVEGKGGTTHKLWVPTGVESEGRPNVWVHVPARFDPARSEVRLVVIFRGHSNCIDSYVSPTGLPCVNGREARTGYDVARQVERSGTRSIVILPELAFDVKSSDAGPLATGGFRAFLRDVLRELAPVVGDHAIGDVQGITIVASSGGYEAALPILQSTRLPIDELVLFDSLYVDNATFSRFVVGHEEAFLPGARAPRRLVLLYCKAQRSQSEVFGRRVEVAILGRSPAAGREAVRFEPRPGVPEMDDLRASVAIHNVALEHDEVVARYLWQVLHVAEEAREARDATP